MRFGSVCSGIEAASVAWNPLGWRAAWLSEIEPFPAAVLAHHYPDVPNLGDMTTLPARIASGEVDAPDVFCGGTPCQAFSVAGLRKSLDDARGNLSLTFCEIANEIDAARSIRGEQPAIVFWENVPGVLNTKDNAFGCFLAGLAGEDDPLVAPGGKWTNAGCVFGPKRTVAWRVLDAQYFGVAQRRRRVFVVASARKGFDPAKVLFEFDGVRRDTAPSRSAGESIAASASSCTASGKPTVGTLMANAGTKLWLGNQEALTGDYHILQPSKQTNAYGIPGNWIGRKPENGGNAVEPMHNVAPCLTSTDRHGVAVGAANPTAVAFALQHAQIGRKDSAGPQGKGWQEGLAFTQDSRSCADVVVQVTAPINMQMATRGAETSNTSREGIGLAKPGDPAFTLQAAHCHAVQSGMAVRRLTPVECERLQGFPDGYTAIPWRKKPASDCPDGPRYKALGNSWAVPVVRWIGERICSEISNQQLPSSQRPSNKPARAFLSATQWASAPASSRDFRVAIIKK